MKVFCDRVGDKGMGRGATGRGRWGEGAGCGGVLENYEACLLLMAGDRQVGRSEDIGEVVGEIEFGSGASAKEFTVGEFLDVVKAAGNAFVSVGIESEEIDAGTTIAT
jgi:hypothetical protein